jgi:hypothetical protein
MLKNNFNEDLKLIYCVVISVYGINLGEFDKLKLALEG